MLKDAYEDYRRHQNDERENKARTEVMQREGQQALNKYWKDIQVGDIIRVKRDEMLPADIVILQSSDAKG